MQTEKIAIKPPFIKLDQLLKFAGLAESGGQATALIQEGLVRVNGEACTQRGKKIRGGDSVELEQQRLEVVERED